MVHRSSIHYSKINEKGNLKKAYKISSGTTKLIGFLDIDTQLNSLKTKWIQRLLNPTNAFWKDLKLY